MKKMLGTLIAEMMGHDVKQLAAIRRRTADAAGRYAPARDALASAGERFTSRVGDLMRGASDAEWDDKATKPLVEILASHADELDRLLPSFSQASREWLQSIVDNAEYFERRQLPPDDRGGMIGLGRSLDDLAASEQHANEARSQFVASFRTLATMSAGRNEALSDAASRVGQAYERWIEIVRENIELVERHRAVVARVTG